MSRLLLFGLAVLMMSASAGCQTPTGMFSPFGMLFGAARPARSMLRRPRLTRLLLAIVRRALPAPRPTIRVPRVTNSGFVLLGFVR
jgi:hypothetical protein